MLGIDLVADKIQTVIAVLAGAGRGLLAAALIAGVPMVAGAATFQTIYNFQGGADGSGGYIEFADASGNLYGITADGGAYGGGSVFELMPPAAGSTVWTKVDLYDFTSTDSAHPGTLVQGVGGNIFGITSGNVAIVNGQAPCTSDCGSVFKLSPPKAGSTKWAKSTIYSSTQYRVSGANLTGLVTDPSGNLYVTTYYGGFSSCYDTCGLVLELSHPAAGTTAWTAQQIYQFKGKLDGGAPIALVRAASGVLYGATWLGGNKSCTELGGYAVTDLVCGTVWQLSPPATVSGTWTKSTLGFSDSTQNLMGSLLLTSTGVLYGASLGGLSDSGGGIFQIKSAKAKSPLSLAQLYAFSTATSSNGLEPVGIVAGQTGLYGTTRFGGIGSCDPRKGSTPGCGVVFSLVPQAGSSTWTEATLYQFTGNTDGGLPTKPVIGLGGALFGTAFAPINSKGISTGNGTIWEIQP